jgi:hypothetical protein
MDLRTRKAYGKRRPIKFPLMVEFGTFKSGERPFLLPALAQTEPYFKAECLKAIRGAYEG